MPDDALITLRNVSKSFEGAAGELCILEDLNLEVKAGERVAIVGPSGSGKSTLLNLIGSLDRPTRGSIVLHGQDIGNLSDRELAAMRNKKVGFIFQNHHLLPQCTLLENVLVPTLAKGKKTSTSDMERAKRLLERVGLSDRLHHRPGQLSGGECQRTAVVRALINQPVLLLGDEPTGALDEKSAKDLADLLLDLNREEEVALIVVTHSPALAARMDRTYEMADGSLVDSK